MKLDNNSQKNQRIPTVLIIFGATGDLMAKKIAPALYHLFIKNKLPKLFTIIGSARRDFSDEDFRNYVKTILDNKVDPSDSRIEDFLSHFSYHKAEFTNKEDYRGLAEKLGNIDGEWKTCANKLFYLAVPPQHYELMFNQLSSSGLTIPCSPEEGWTRIIVEKPFGDNYETAQKLDAMLGTLFKEEQIYRIDHYLAKEMLQNILVFRFTNNLLEKVWNHESIESIEVMLFETLGVEKRGAFYDKVGALKDVGQNHILQMVALITMENPLSFSSEAIRKSRSELLGFLPLMTPNQIRTGTKRAQYKGYNNIEGVAKNSTTETFFSIQFSLTNPRWEHIPITVKAGKRTGQARKDIIITFKHPSPCLCPPNGEHMKNKIIFSMDPKEEIKIQFWSKKPGLTMEVQKADFNFVYQEKSTATQYTDEYEKLLLDCIEGNQLLFVSTNEVVAMWKFIDPIMKEWKHNTFPLERYEPDSSYSLVTL